MSSHLFSPWASQSLYFQIHSFSICIKREAISYNKIKILDYHNLPPFVLTSLPLFLREREEKGKDDNIVVQMVEDCDS